MQIEIREATAADLPVLQLFEQELIREERPFDPTIRPDPVHYYDLPSLIWDSDTCLLVAERDGQVVASGYATRKTPRHYLDHNAYAYFGFMYTLPSHRGLGINGRIISSLRHWARREGLYEIRLTVYRDNLPALRAYEKVGFGQHLVEMRLREVP